MYLNGKIVFVCLLLVGLPFFCLAAQDGKTVITNIESPGPGNSVEAKTRIRLDGTPKDYEEFTELPAEDIGSAAGQGLGSPSERAIKRRNQVANAVQEMLQVAERNQGVGQQIKAVAQAQNENQEQMEAEMARIESRSAIRKFFFGPDYRRLNSVEDKLMLHEKKLEDLKILAEELNNKEDKSTMEEQILIMEKIKAELEQEVADAGKGFSLFGWLNKLLSK